MRLIDPRGAIAEFRGAGGQVKTIREQISFKSSFYRNVFVYLLSQICPSVCRLSVTIVCNVRVPTQPVEIFGNVSHFVRCHLLTSVQNFTVIVPEEPLRRELNAKGVAKYSNVGPVGGYEV